MDQPVQELSPRERMLVIRDRLTATYFEARTEYEYLKDQAEEAKRKMDSLAFQLVDVIDQCGGDHYFKDGMRVDTKRHFGISVTQENSDVWRSWLSERFGDDEPFLKTVVDKSNLQDRIKSDLEGGNLTPDEVPDWANLKTTKIISITGWKK